MAANMIKRRFLEKLKNLPFFHIKAWTGQLVLIYSPSPLTFIPAFPPDFLHPLGFLTDLSFRRRRNKQRGKLRPRYTTAAGDGGFRRRLRLCPVQLTDCGETMKTSWSLQKHPTSSHAVKHKTFLLLFFFCRRAQFLNFCSL